MLRLRSLNVFAHNARSVSRPARRVSTPYLLPQVFRAGYAGRDDIPVEPMNHGTTGVFATAGRFGSRAELSAVNLMARP